MKNATEILKLNEQAQHQKGRREEIISELEDKTTGITQSEQQKEDRLEREK